MSVDERWGKKMTENFHENKMFCKELQRIKKGTFGNKERVKREDGTILVEKEAVKERWVEFFEVLFNVEEDKEVEIVAVGRENGIKVLGGLNNAQITIEEVEGAVKEMKATGLDWCAVQCMKSVSISMIAQHKCI